MGQFFAVVSFNAPLASAQLSNPHHDRAGQSPYPAPSWHIGTLGLVES